MMKACAGLVVAGMLLSGVFVLASFVSRTVYTVAGKDFAPWGNVIGFAVSFSIFGVVAWREYKS